MRLKFRVVYDELAKNRKTDVSHFSKYMQATRQQQNWNSRHYKAIGMDRDICQVLHRR
jgi:hypothetical protein